MIAEEDHTHPRETAGGIEGDDDDEYSEYYDKRSTKKYY